MLRTIFAIMSIKFLENLWTDVKADLPDIFVIFS